MAQDSNEVRVYGDGNLYVAPVDTAFPTDITTAVDDDAWVQLGYISTDGVTFKVEKEMKDIEVWQSRDPVRTIRTKSPKTLKLDLVQWNYHTALLALGGGTVTGTPGNYTYNPPDESESDERAFILEAIDGDYTVRYCFRRGENQTGTELKHVSDDALMLPIEIKVLAASNGAKPYFIQTDDPNLAPAGVAS